MPKIVKNGLEYSGTPLEEVTAWPPTGDSVQIEQPLIGNTDISEVGDGTVTGAIDALNNGLTRNKKGTTVNLSNSATDYTFPSDGYLIVSTSSTANAVAIVDLRDSTSSYIGAIGGQGNSNYPSWATFVRAGMIVRIRTVSNSGYVAFVPLVS